MKKLLLAASALVCTVSASAHTVTWGYEDLGSGNFTVWSGSYHGSGVNEGNLLYTPVTQAGVSTGSGTSVIFNLFSNTKPSGLLDGTTNFYSAGSGSMGSTPGDGGTPVIWQGVSISGIATGYYLLQYDPTSTFSAVWDPYDDSISNGVIIQLGGGGGLGAPTDPNAAPATITTTIDGSSPLVTGATATFEGGTVTPTTALTPA